MSDWDELAKEFGGKSAHRVEDEDAWTQLARLHRVPQSTVTSPKPDNSDQALMLRGIASDMPWYQRAAAQFGSGLSNVGLAAKQIVGKATPQEAQEKRFVDKQLQDVGLGGNVLGFLGDVAPTLAIPNGLIGRGVSKFAPGLAPTVEGASQGAIVSGLQPVGPGESRGFNMAVGAAGGGLVPGIVSGYRASLGRATPESAALARKAIQEYGIPLQASDITDSKILKTINSIASDLPVTGAVANAKREAKRTAYNRAVGKTFGADADKITPDVANDAYTRMGDTFNDIYGRNPADAFSVQARVAPILAKAKSEATPDIERIVGNKYDELMSKVDPGTGQIDGQFFNNWQKSVRRIGDSKNEPIFGDLRSAALKAYNDGVSGADAELLSKTRGQYRNYKTVEPLINKAEGGDLNPALLQQQVIRSFSDYGRGGGGELGDLARIGKQFMVDRVPQTGGSLRAALQNNSAIGGAIAGTSIGGPVGGLVGAVTPSMTMGLLNAAGNNNIARDYIIRKALEEPETARRLLSTTVSGRAMLEDLAKKAGVQSLPAAGLLSTFGSF